jgi:integrase
MPPVGGARRRRCRATTPDVRPATKGRLYPADPPSVEDIVAVMRELSDDRHGYRLRALIAVLWCGGLRVQEALALGERDLDPRRGLLLVRNGKGGRRREIGMDAWGWERLGRWLAARLELPVGALFCVIDGPILEANPPTQKADSLTRRSESILKDQARRRHRGMRGGRARRGRQVRCVGGGRRRGRARGRALRRGWRPISGCWRAPRRVAPAARTRRSEAAAAGVEHARDAGDVRLRQAGRAQRPSPSALAIAVRGVRSRRRAG